MITVQHTYAQNMLRSDDYVQTENIFLLNATINLFVATRWSIKNRDAYHNKWKWEKSLDVVSMDNYSSSRGQLTNYIPSDRESEFTANKTHYCFIVCVPKKTIPKKIYQNYRL